MKHKGSICQVNVSRNRNALDLYRKAIRSATWPTSTMQLCEHAASMPVSEFYIPEDAAVKYVRNRIYGGHAATFINPYRQRLFEALHDRVLELMAKPQHSSSSLPSIVYAALATKAPCIGMTPRSIYLLLPHKRYNRRKKKTAPPPPPENPVSPVSPVSPVNPEHPENP